MSSNKDSPKYSILLTVKVDTDNRMHKLSFDWVEEKLREALNDVVYHHGEAPTTDLIVIDLERIKEEL